MRTLLRAVLLLLCTQGFAEEKPVNHAIQGSNQFALDLHAQLRERPGNLFYSPASLSIALAMTQAGARGETAAQMSRVLHFDPGGEGMHDQVAEFQGRLNPPAGAEGLQLSLANRLWGQADCRFLADFLRITRQVYGAELQAVDFKSNPSDARKRINDWVGEKTRGKIRDLIPDGVLSDLTRLVLTNAVYFKGDWSRPFSRSNTRDENFQAPGGKSVRAPLMFREDSLQYLEGDGVKVLELPYGAGVFSAVFILPDQVDGLPGLEARLKPSDLDRWTKALRPQKVKAFVPRFKVTSQLSLNDVLGAMGMPLAFDAGSADFKGISTEDELYLSAVLHKAFVDVNEEGTEAAAATGVIVATRATAVARPSAVFRADHPFLFLIRDRDTGAILFMGRIEDPTS